MGSRNAKKQILNAAVKIMEQKGSEATISEIAAAGVNDSMIYHYFKNKEDLMFHTVSVYAKSWTESFLSQIQGIQDPLNRLSKLIREQFHYHETNPYYTKYTIFFCRFTGDGSPGHDSRIYRYGKIEYFTGHRTKPLMDDFDELMNIILKTA